MRVMSACVKNHWLIIFSFLYFGYNYQISFTFFFSNNKRLCKGVCGILDMVDKDYRIFLNWQHLPRDIKLVVQLPWSYIKTLLSICGFRYFSSFCCCFHVVICSHSFTWFPFPVKLLNSRYMENITMGKHKFIYITFSSDNISCSFLVLLVIN